MPLLSQALDAGSAAALPDGLRTELEKLEDQGGLQSLTELVAQVKVNPVTPLYATAVLTFTFTGAQLTPSDRGCHRELAKHNRCVFKQVLCGGLVECDEPP